MRLSFILLCAIFALSSCVNTTDIVIVEDVTVIIVVETEDLNE